jgi:hypothetical protein
MSSHRNRENLIDSAHSLASSTFAQQCEDAISSFDPNLSFEDWAEGIIDRHPYWDVLVIEVDGDIESAKLLLRIDYDNQQRQPQAA